MEGTGVVYELGHHVVVIQEAHQRDHEVGQHGHAQQRAGHLVGQVGILRLARLLNGLLDPLGDVVDGIIGVEQDLAQRLVDFVAHALFQRHEGYADVVAGVEPLVDDEAVDFGVLADRAYVGGQYQRHVGDVAALPALVADVARHALEVQVQPGKHLRVVAMRHDVGGELNDGVDIAQAAAVVAFSEHVHHSLAASFNMIY